MDAPFRVLQVVYRMNRGGIENFVMNIYRNIDRDKIQFDFLTQGKGTFDKEILNFGGHIYRLPPRNEGILRHNMAVSNFFRSQQKYRTVHIHISNLSSIATLKAAKYNKINKRIIHAHSSLGPKGFHHRLFHWWHKFSIDKWGTHYFACSDKAGIFLFGDMFDQGKVDFIANGINVNKYLFDSQLREKVRRTLNIKSNTLLLGHVGNFSFAKNHSFLLDIFNVVHRRYNNSNLLLIGDGPLSKNINHKINILGLDNAVKVLGARSDVHLLLQAIDIFVLPSHYEGLPVVGLEAQASGLKCFLSNVITKQVDICGLVDYLALDNNPEQWAENILKYKDGYERKNTANKIIAAGFDSADVAKKLQDIYLD